MTTTKPKQPPQTILWQGKTLELYSDEPQRVNGRVWYTYHRPGFSGLWEHCPATGQTLKTQ